jgi:hypothetical protein
LYLSQFTGTGVAAAGSGLPGGVSGLPVGFISIGR